MSARLPGRQFFANPGPTNIPDSVLREMSHQTVDFMSTDFLALYEGCVAGLKRLIGTNGDVFFYTASGHGAWEATLVNLFSPGDVLLVIETGVFSESWAAMMAKHGLVVRTVAADWRAGVDYAAVTAALRADTAGEIRAVCCVHNETSTGMTMDLPAVRAAMDDTGRGGLLLADGISSLGCLEFHMDAWGVDAVVGGSQKGLMLPVGFSFTAVGPRAMAAHATARLARHYFDWQVMLGRRHRSFVGTAPAGMFFALAEALRLLEGEGMPAVVARHHRLGGAVRAAVRAWSGNDGPTLFPLDLARASDSVSAILVPEGHDAEAVRRAALGYGVSLGGGLGPLGGRVFRIGHLGDLNEPMVLGTLGGVELALRAVGVPHGRGGVEAAVDALAA